MMRVSLFSSVETTCSPLFSLYPSLKEGLEVGPTEVLLVHWALCQLAKEQHVPNLYLKLIPC